MKISGDIRIDAGRWRRPINISAISWVFSELAASKRIGQKCDVRDGYFKTPVGAHVIYYRQASDAIEVVRVLHGRMDVNRHL